MLKQGIAIGLLTLSSAVTAEPVVHYDAKFTIGNHQTELTSSFNLGKEVAFFLPNRDGREAYRIDLQVLPGQQADSLTARHRIYQRQDNGLWGELATPDMTVLPENSAYFEAQAADGTAVTLSLSNLSLSEI
ncbi:hypothetical protein SAMN02745129_3685 [Ferrimonas marina]|uniref:Uncharacterized protein n=2 Tax=Ferrimonas marina TaxID=299255 RepID=A0A1M5XTC8_9GAMM|nr:hypothetical protein SAMN02745129_3685 [Ferrimonas marina]